MLDRRVVRKYGKESGKPAWYNGPLLHVEEHGFVLALQVNIKKPASRTCGIRLREKCVASRRRHERDHCVFGVSWVACEINSCVELLEHATGENGHD